MEQDISSTIVDGKVKTRLSQRHYFDTYLGIILNGYILLIIQSTDATNINAKILEIKLADTIHQV